MLKNTRVILKMSFKPRLIQSHLLQYPKMLILIVSSLLLLELLYIFQLYLEGFSSIYTHSTAKVLKSWPPLNLSQCFNDNIQPNYVAVSLLEYNRKMQEMFIQFYKQLVTKVTSTYRDLSLYLSNKRNRSQISQKELSKLDIQGVMFKQRIMETQER